MNQKTNDNDEARVTPEEERHTPAEPGVPAEQDLPPAETADGAGATPAAEPAPGRSRTGTAVAWLALLLALAAVAGVGYLAWVGRDSGAANAENEASIASLADNLDETHASLRELEERLGELSASDSAYADELDSIEQQLDELLSRYESMPARLSSLESSVSSLQGISTGAREAWLLAEAEYYMQIANAQLQLAGNAERALLALRYADQRIRQLADPALIDVRRALARELRALEAMEQPDLEGMSMTLASLAEAVEALPLREDVTRPEDEPQQENAEAGAIERARASIKSAFSGIVSVRRTDEAVTPLMSPDARYFLRANLALRLQSARLALLRGEQAIFEQSLEDAAAWLREYYASDSRAVQSALETIAALREDSFSVTPPDISESLRLLRQFDGTATSTPPATDAPADEPAQ